MPSFGMNRPVQRTEDDRLLRGAGRYVDDVYLPRQAAAYVLRAPHAHARIKRLDVTAARTAPGVLDVITGADYRNAGFAPMPQIFLPVPGFDPATAMYPAQHWPLADDRVRYVGDGVAMIVAETRAQAADAAERIEVDYDTLDAVTETARANTAGAPRVWDDCAGNVAFRFSLGNADAVEDGMARAMHVVKTRFRINRLSANPIEPRGVVADFDAARGQCTVYLGTQDSFKARAQLADMLRLAEGSLRVVTGDVGGSFGMKGAMYAETPLVVWASQRLGRPVKWVSDRSEAFVSDCHARDKWIEAELALDPEYRFLALRVHALSNVGAYYSTLATFPIILSTSGIVGAYATPAVHFRATAVFTNTNPTSPYRGSGRPDAALIIERVVDHAARALDVDPADLRRRNMIAPGAMPFRTVLGPVYDCGDFPGNLAMALDKAEVAGFAARRARSTARGRLRGLGIGANVEGSAPPGLEQARVDVDSAGTVTLAVGSTDQGQGHATLYTQVACDALGIGPERVRVTEGDTGALHQGFGTGGSKVSALGALAVHAAARALIDKGRALAAHLFEASEADVIFDAGLFRLGGTDRVLGLSDLARAADDPAKLPAGMGPGLSALGSQKTAAPTWPSGCHVCEVEVDPDTGQVSLERYVAVSDLGRAVNPLQANGQVMGGIVQGIGQVLSENVAHDPASGQLLTGSFMDYAMPRSDHLCTIECFDNPVPTAVNPLGVKGAGEVGAGCAVPAVLHAVIDALSPLGVHHLDLPCTPERIWNAIRDARRSRGSPAARSRFT